MTRKTYLFWMDQDDQPSSVIAMKLSNSNCFFIRLTGGCGYMSREDGERSISILTETLSGFGGAVLYGGTRVLAPNNDGYEVFPTILEVPPLLRSMNPRMMSFGIVPRMINVEFSEHGLIIGREKDSGFLTVIHPNQDVCLILQKNVDQPSFWDAERIACQQITQEFYENRKGFGAALVAFNGGEVTKREIQSWAEANLPVILFADSGRTTSQFCQDRDWLAAHPSVTVCFSAQEARSTIKSLGGFLE